ncbi:MAG: helix-turn-helix domain-containing protein [Mogibacterium sp.]|nr:helix-turn-helix domain-containing protein [Mogibacterium sp.]
MSYYCSFGDLQDELRSYYRKTGERLQFGEAIDRILAKGKLLQSNPNNKAEHIHGHASIDEFEKITDSMYFAVTPIELTHQVFEEDMIPRLNDVLIIRHPRYTRPYLHRHDYVEINYVVRGSCTMYFEEEVLTLAEGDLDLISPSSYHDIEITDESTVYCIMLRRSTFQSAFFSLLSRDDILSAFFRKMLTDLHTPNYLIFHAEDKRFMQIMAQSAMEECHAPDLYSNSCCISLIYLLFASLLRSEVEEPRFYHSQSSSEFLGILNYIRRNHRTITLTELADVFHYSKPHMCTIIKQNTGVSFSVLIRQVRMKDASEYLTKTDLSVSDIADLVGYNSADNFSRVFRKTYGMSPVEYRKANMNSDTHFVPFRYV